MQITKISPLSGEHTLEIAVTEEQLEAWENGMLIQNAMPNLTAAEREFIKTGYTEEDWKRMFEPYDAHVVSTCDHAECGEPTEVWDGKFCVYHNHECLQCEDFYIPKTDNDEFCSVTCENLYNT